MLRPARWCREYGADAVAAEHVGQTGMIAALIELGQLTGDFTSVGDDHPSLLNRILSLLLFATPTPETSAA